MAEHQIQIPNDSNKTKRLLYGIKYEQLNEDIQNLQGGAANRKKKFIPYVNERDGCGKLIKKKPQQLTEKEIILSTYTNQNKTIKGQNNIVYNYGNMFVQEKANSLSNILLGDLKGEYQIDANQPDPIKYDQFKLTTVFFKNGAQLGSDTESEDAQFLTQPLKMSSSQTSMASSSSHFFRAKGRDRNVKSQQIKDRITVPSIGYYNLNYDKIDHKVQNIRIQGKTQSQSDLHRPNSQLEAIEPNFKQVDRQVLTPDFNKYISRFQTNRFWAPVLYQIEKKKLQKFQELDDINNKELEGEFMFFMQMQKKYPMTIQRPKIILNNVLKKRNQPFTKTEIREKTIHLLERRGINIYEKKNEKKFMLLKQKFSLGMNQAQGTNKFKQFEENLKKQNQK